MTTVARHPFLRILAAAGKDRVLRLWDAECGAVLDEVSVPAPVVLDLAFAPDGASLAAGLSDRTVRVWSLNSFGAASRPYAGPADWVQAVAWDAESRFVGGGSVDGSIWVWDAATGTECSVRRPGGGAVFALVAHPHDDTFASAGRDGRVRVWQWRTEECQRVLSGHSDAVQALAGTHDWLLSGSLDRTVRVWSWQSEACVRVLRGTEGGCFFLRSLSFNDTATRLVLLESAKAKSDGDVLVGIASVWDASGAHPDEWVSLKDCSPIVSSRFEGLCALGADALLCASSVRDSDLSVWTFQ